MAHSQPPIICIHDFLYMRCGRSLGPLSSTEINLLAPINQRSRGNKRALLLLHGFASSPAVYRKLLPLLTRFDAIICPVLPGHAESISAFAQSSAHEWIKTAEMVYQQLSVEYAQVSIMGLSLGGLIACHLAQIFHPQHLYLLAPALNLHLNLPVMLTLAKLLQSIGVNKLPNRAGNLCTNAAAELTYRQLPLHAIIQVLTLIRDFTFAPPTCPTDIFLGKFDSVVNSSAIAKRFADLPNAQIHWLQNSAHVLPLDNDYSLIANIINQ